jgi:hypothetical protein
MNASPPHPGPGLPGELVTERRFEDQMQSASHTEGPWLLEDHCDDYKLVDKDGEFVAYLSASRYPDGRDDPEQEANCRLIAAAPDLLEALQNIMARLDEGVDAPGHLHDVPGVWDADNAPDKAGKRCDWCDQWNRARAAISKATRS